MRLEGKVALITGGSRGQGATEAELFVKEGARVVVADILEPEGNALVAQIREGGGDASFIRLDVTSEDDWEDAVEFTLNTYSRLDILINNAAIYKRTPIVQTGPGRVEPDHGYQQHGRVPGNQARSSGDAGVGGRIHHQHFVNRRTWSAAKGAVRMALPRAAFGSSPSTRLYSTPEDGIRANSIHPGPIDTEMIKGEHIYT